MTQDELDLVETADLFETLARRSVTVVLLTLDSLDNKDDKRVIYYRGGQTTALGLLAWGETYLLRGDLNEIT